MVHYLKMLFRISVVTLRVAVLAAVLAAEPRMEPELLEDELFLVAVFFLAEDEVLRLEDELPVIFLPTDVPT